MLRLPGAEGISPGNPNAIMLFAVSHGSAGARLPGDFHDGTDFDCAGAGARYTRRDRDRFVEILRLNYIVAAKLLLRFRERSVGRDGLAVTNSDRGRGAGRFERIAGLEFAGLHDVLRERHVLLMELSVLRRA